MTPPDRCPTCDRDTCGLMALGWRVNVWDERWPAANADCHAHAADWRARTIAAESDAAKWRRVAPTIEALRVTAEIEGGDTMAVVEAAMDLLAAAEVAP